MRITKTIAMALCACVLVGAHAFAFDVGVSSGIDGSFDVHGGDVVSAAEVFAAVRTDADARLSRRVTLDNRTNIRGGANVQTGTTRGLAASETGLTYRAAPFTAHIANDTIGQLTSDERDDYLITDVTANFSWGTPDYSVFFEPGMEWSFNALTDVDRRVRTGVSAMVRNDMIADVAVELGDRENDDRHQMRLLGEAEFDWYTPGASTVGFSTGVGRFTSQDESELNGEMLPIWSYTELQAGSQFTVQTSPSSRVGLEIPVTRRWYAHNYVQENQLGETGQVSTRVEPDLSVSLWPAEYLELRSELGASITRSNTPALEETRMQAGVSLHLSL